MSIGALKLLGELGLLDRRGHPVDVAGLSDDRLRGFLHDYYNARSEGAKNEVARYAEDRAPLATLISSISATADMRTVLPALLVFGRVHVPDALFAMSVPETSATRAYRTAVGGAGAAPVARQSVCRAIEFLAQMEGLIRDGALVVLPTELVHARGESVPVFYAEDNYESAFPEVVRNFIDAHAQVRQALVDKTSGEVFVPSELAATPSRAISISFRDDAGNKGMFFILSSIRSMVPLPQPGHYKVQYDYDLEKPVKPDEYEVWRTQSIRRTALNRLDSVGREIALSSTLGATYLTQSSFESQLLGMAGRLTTDSNAAQAVNFLLANSPPIAITGPRQVLNVRRNDRQAFAHLQQALLDAAVELRGVDPKDFDARAQALLRRIVEPELRKAKSRVSRFASHGASVVVSTSASLALALLTGGGLPVGALLGLIAAGTAANSIPSVAEYIKTRNTPEHILWRLQGRGNG